MSTNRLPDLWVAKIFDRLLGVYGNQFAAKFSRIENGVDVGILGAKQVWAEELAGFAGDPDAIAYALRNLPADFPPNAIQFVALCRRSPPRDCARIEYKVIEADPERTRETLDSLKAFLSRGKVFNEGS